MEVFVISTENPSKVFVHNLWENQIRVFRGVEKHKTVSKNKEYQPKNIYITSDEEIKEGDEGSWCILGNELIKIKAISRSKHCVYFGDGIDGSIYACKKIKLTTDHDLIKDGIKDIDDNFLEWFVENQDLVRSI